jgi:hypothetical protein
LALSASQISGEQPDWHLHLDNNATNGPTMAQNLRDRLRRNSADILEVLEVVSQWQANPIEAARTDMREMIENKARLDAEQRQAEADAQLQAEITRRSEEFIESLRTEAEANKAKSEQAANQ